MQQSQPTLPGVFESNKLTAVNGALWTLKIEAMFYFCVPIFSLLFRKFSNFPVLIFGYIGSVVYASIFTLAAERTGSGIYVELARQLPGQLSYFFAGAFFYYYLPLLERYTSHFLAAATLTLIANKFLPLSALEPFALATVVVFFGLFLYAGNIGKYGDFSYGVYIIHFPIIQLFIYLNWNHDNPWTFLATVMLTTLLCAIALWHLVEKRFLSRKNHYICGTSDKAQG